MNPATSAPGALPAEPPPEGLAPSSPSEGQIGTGLRSSHPGTAAALARVARLFLRTAGRRLLLGILLSALTVLAGMALLGISGWFITASALAGATIAAALAFDVFTPSASIRLLALGRTASRYAERVTTHDATLGVLAALRERLFRGWAQPQAARSLLQRPARLLFRLTQDVDALESVYLRVVVPICSAVAATLLAGAVLSALDLRLGLAMSVWLLVFGTLVALGLARRARRLALRRALKLERLRAQTVDLVAGQTDLVTAGRLDAQCEGILRTEHRLGHVDDALNGLEVRATLLHGIGSHLTVAAVLLAVGALAGQGALSTPAAALALLVALAALEPFGALRRGALEAGRSALAARRLAPRLDGGAAGDTDTTATAAPSGAASVTPAMQSVALKGTLRESGTASASEASATGAAIRLKQIRATHVAGARPALIDLDLEVRAGERIAVVGASGAGKSTLLAVIAAELALVAGRASLPACTWLTQRTELFQDTVRDNLRLAAADATDAQLWAALEAGGLAEDVGRFSQGLDTILGEGGLGLSGGQSRRLALARLLLHPADCWLLDEPTEGLDQTTADDVLDRLAALAGGRTVLIATHGRREATFADRLITLDRGRLVSDLRRGSPDFQAALGALRQH